MDPEKGSKLGDDPAEEIYALDRAGGCVPRSQWWAGW